MERVPMTPAGFEKMRLELSHLKSVERPQNIKDIEEARAHGDLSENAEYSAAKEKQSLINGRILDLEDVISRAEIINPTEIKDKTKIIFGATVGLLDINEDVEINYQIVGEYESDIKNNRVSITSPIAKALIGKRVGDEVKVQTPKGSREFEVLSINYI